MQELSYKQRGPLTCSAQQLFLLALEWRHGRPLGYDRGGWAGTLVDVRIHVQLMGGDWEVDWVEEGRESRLKNKTSISLGTEQINL